MTPLAFLSLLYNGMTARGWVEFRFLKGGTRAWMPWPTFVGHPDEFKAEQVPAGRDAYFGVALRREQTDGKAANCLPTHLHWVDVDLKDHPELTGGQTELLEVSAEELDGYKTALLSQILERAAQLNLPPRAVVDSGHGLQVYWAQRAGVPAEETEDGNKRLMLAFGGDGKSIDIARILRVPGTRNRKNPQRPLLVHVLYQDTEAWVDAAQVAALPAPEKPKSTAPAPGLWAGAPLQGTTQERYAQSALRREIEALQAAGEGGRNDALNRAAFALGTLVGAGVLDEIEAAQQLSDVALSIGLEAEEVRDTLHSGLTHGKANPRDLAHVGRKPPSAGQGTLAGNAAGQGSDTSPYSIADVLAALPEKPTLANHRDLVLADFFENGQVYRYHQIWRNWWRYDRGVYIEVPDEVMAQKVDLTLQAHGFTLKNAQITEILVKIGRDPLVGSSDTDQGSWELNTCSGVLDLATGELYDHTPAYYSIIQSAAYYRPEAVAHDWLAFLAEAVPNEGDRHLLQQFAGLCLTGDTSAQRALLLVGDGGTGKSTFVRVLQAVLGNLATSSALENIKDGSFLVGTLVGKRMCVVSELQRNVDWLPFKRVTGEDQISIDVKNKTPYTSKLDLKLIILSNVMPFLGDDTSNSSLMRRFLPVAFNVRPTRPDPTLEGRLTVADELSGVLNWMLEGLESLRQQGMRFPAGDSAALAREIVEESNRVVTFLRDACTYVPGASTASNELYAAYREWCGQTGHRALSSTSFGKQLTAAGKHFGKPLDKVRKSTGVMYLNVLTSSTPEGWEEVTE